MMRERLTLAVLIAVASPLAGCSQQLTDKQKDEVTDLVDDASPDVLELETKIGDLTTRLDQAEEELSEAQSKVSDYENRISALEDRLGI